MKKLVRNPYTYAFALAVFIVSGILISMWLNNEMQQFVETRFYTGTLTSIKYEHSGCFGSVAATVLEFEDGATFRRKGHYMYQVGQNYSVKYEKLAHIVNVLSVTKTPTKEYSHLEVFSRVKELGNQQTLTVYYVAESKEGWQKGINKLLYQTTNFSAALEWALNHAEEVK